MSKKSIVRLAEIGLMAIEVQSIQNAVKGARFDLDAAYEDFKLWSHLERVDPDSAELLAMNEATKPQYEALKKQKNLLRNAQRRLARMIKKEE